MGCPRCRLGLLYKDEGDLACLQCGWRSTVPTVADLTPLIKVRPYTLPVTGAKFARTQHNGIGRDE